MTPSQAKHHQITSLQRLPLVWLFALVVLMAGCGSAGPALSPSALSISPAGATLSVGDQLRLSASGTSSEGHCSWSVGRGDVLGTVAEATFEGRSPGTTEVIATCGGATAHADVIVKSKSTGPIVITRGGVYSGTWISEDPQVPAVLVQTTDPVTLRDATVAGRGDLIAIPANGSGANVTIERVTGVGLDPGLKGVQRGNFVVAESVAALTVRNCTMSGVRFGVKVLSSRPSELLITKNVAKDLEDRESDGAGGFLPDRPDLGHFVMLNEVSARHGAEISWNQMSNTLGKSSTEDVINIYKSQGSPNFPIVVHDNYMEGNSSPSRPDDYTGAGLIADGDSTEDETAFVTFVRNQVVHTAGSGVEIAGGHDIEVSDNRVVSCGIAPDGTWYAALFVNAIVVWNYYGEPSFKNISVHGTTGGMLRPSPEETASVADIWTRAEDLDASDRIGTNRFTDPCLKNGSMNFSAEDDERTLWQAKLANARVNIGDPNAPQ